MIPIDLSGKVALVTGVGNEKSFAWFIAKALQAAGASSRSALSASSSSRSCDACVASATNGRRRRRGYTWALSPYLKWDGQLFLDGICRFP